MPKEVRRIPLRLIDRDPNQPRRTFNQEKIKNLVRSIREEELAHFPTVKPHPRKRGRFILVSGERRIRAVEYLGWKDIICRVYTGKKDSYRLSLVENLHRENLNPIELAEALKRLREEEHMTYEAVSELTGLVSSQINATLKLLDLPKKIQDMVATETLPKVAALRLRQYKGEKGRLIRLAYDLIAGKDEAMLAIAQLPEENERGKNIRMGKMPDTSEGLLLRILTFSYNAPSVKLVINAFAAMSSEKQTQGWRYLNPRVRESLPRYIEELQVSLGQLQKVLAGLSA
ncbi:MAG: ParB/RepB/Spo0J family partition protein [Patescibacteria group bacterium]